LQARAFSLVNGDNRTEAKQEEEDKMSNIPPNEIRPEAEVETPPFNQQQPPYYGRAYYQDPRRKSPVLAGVLSLMPGLGQVYVGYYQHGFVNVLVVASLIAMLAGGYLGPMVPLGAFFLAFFWLYNMVDAWRKASLYNQMLAGLGPTQLPEEMEKPESKGSLVGGIALIAFGALMFAHTKFNFSLEWMEDWWPMALILLGAYLIFIWARASFMDDKGDIRK